MKPTTPTGYVPVTIQLPSDLAEQFQYTDYNWEALVRLVTTEHSPQALSAKLLDLYFDYTRLLVLGPDEVAGDTPNLLYSCQQLYRAIQQMEAGTNTNPVDHGAGSERSE